MSQERRGIVVKRGGRTKFPSKNKSKDVVIKKVEEEIVEVPKKQDVRKEVSRVRPHSRQLGQFDQRQRVTRPVGSGGRSSGTDLTRNYIERGQKEFKKWSSLKIEATPNHVGGPIALSLSQSRYIEFLSAFCVHAGTVFNDYTHDAELCKLFLYLRDNSAVYPATGLFPRMFLDVVAALKGGKNGDKELYSTTFPSMTFAVPNYASFEFCFFVRSPGANTSGWYDAGTIPTTATTLEMQPIMEKLRSVLDVVDAATYVSPHRNDPSVFAWNTWKRNAAVNSYFPCLYDGTNANYTLERTVCLEVPIKTPWMAALGFFDDQKSVTIDARTCNHSMQVCSSPAAVVWACLSGLKHLAHNVQFKPVSTANLMTRMGAFLTGVNSMSAFTWGQYDITWLTAVAVMSKLSKYAAAYCNLRVESAVPASQFGVGNVPSMLHTTMKLPWNLMESLNRLVPVVRDGRIYLPCTDATVFTTLLNQIPTSAGTSTITSFTNVNNDFISDTLPCWANMKLGTLLNAMANVNRNLSQSIRLDYAKMYDSKRSSLHFTTWKDIAGNYQGVSCSYAFAGALYKLIGKLELPVVNSNDPHIGAAKYNEPYYAECPDTSYAQLILAFTNDQIVKPGTMWSNAGDLVIDADGSRFATQKKKIIPNVDGLVAKGQEDFDKMIANENENSNNGADIWAMEQESYGVAQGVRRVATKESLDRDLSFMNPSDRAEFLRTLAKQNGQYQTDTYKVLEKLSFILPRHGKYGGISWTAGREGAERLGLADVIKNPPQDDEDTAYMMHDLSYDKANNPEDVKAADKALVSRLESLQKKGQLSTFGSAAKLYYTLIYSNKKYNDL